MQRKSASKDHVQLAVLFCHLKFATGIAKLSSMLQASSVKFQTLATKYIPIPLILIPVCGTRFAMLYNVHCK